MINWLKVYIQLVDIKVKLHLRFIDLIITMLSDLPFGENKSMKITNNHEKCYNRLCN